MKNYNYTHTPAHTVEEDAERKPPMNPDLEEAATRTAAATRAADTATHLTTSAKKGTRGIGFCDRTGDDGVVVIAVGVSGSPGRVVGVDLQ